MYNLISNIMFQKKIIPSLILVTMLSLSVSAQDDKKDKEKDKRESEYKDKEKNMDKDKDKYKNKDKEYPTSETDSDVYERGTRTDPTIRNPRPRDRQVQTRRRAPQGEQPRPRTRGILERVILPSARTAPRQLVDVPKGHYPPPGSCRIWYPNKPAGHQPPPTSCDNLVGVQLEPGAFILHGDKAYDSEYDWNEEEKRNPQTVSREILDILFPPRR